MDILLLQAGRVISEAIEATVRQQGLMLLVKNVKAVAETSEVIAEVHHLRLMRQHVQLIII